METFYYFFEKWTTAANVQVMETFNDDEEIKLPPVSARRPVPSADGRVQLNHQTSYYTAESSNNQKILLELTGGDSISNIGGLDLVAVLDVSGSMGREQLDKVKTAMYFVIKKLSPVDRLSIVTFSSEPYRASKLRQISPESQRQLEDKVTHLEAGGGTNTFGGLKMGLKVLNDRKITNGRSCGIILMSGGDQSIQYGDAATVPIGDVAVYTFGFGEGMDPKLLNKIATNSKGGTFSDVRNMDNLNQAFSLCLGGLLTVVVNDLTVTVEQVDGESTLEEVFVTGYPQSKDSATGSVTISFGSLYSEEVRKVLVDVLLPDTPNAGLTKILNVIYTYKYNGELIEATPSSVGVFRWDWEMPGDQQQEPQAVKDEIVRQKHTGNIKEASQLADDEKLEQARNKIDEACKELVDGNQNNALIKSLVAELKELKRLMRSQDIYNSVGRAFVYAATSSHERQRPSAKGDDVAKFVLYATPVALKLLDQSKNFEKNPSEPVNSLAQEISSDLAAELKVVDASNFDKTLAYCRKPSPELDLQPSSDLTAMMSEDLAAELEVAIRALQR